MAFTDFSDKHLFFDLDRTLWDFDRNSETTIRQILKNENIEGRYTDEHWGGVTKLTDVFNKHGIDYDLEDTKYQHNNDFKSQLPNSKVYTYNINVMDNNGKQHILPLRVNCAFVGNTGTMTDKTYELTYYFMV